MTHPFCQTVEQRQTSSWWAWLRCVPVADAVSPPCAVGAMEDQCLQEPVALLSATPTQQLATPTSFMAFSVIFK